MHVQNHNHSLNHNAEKLVSIVNIVIIWVFIYMFLFFVYRYTNSEKPCCKQLPKIYQTA